MLFGWLNADIVTVLSGTSRRLQGEVLVGIDDECFRADLLSGRVPQFVAGRRDGRPCAMSGLDPGALRRRGSVLRVAPPSVTATPNLQGSRLADP